MSKERKPWSRIYSRTHLTGFRYYRRLELIRQLLNPHISSETRLLDLGCGDGTWLRYVSRHIGYGVGIDVGWNNATEEWSSPPENIVLKKGDFFTCCIDAELFDVVCCFETLEHFRDPYSVICLMKKCLKPGGIAVISVPIEIGPSVLVKQLVAKATRYNRDATWTLMELVNAVFYNVGEIKKQRATSEYGGEKGFDYRDIENLFNQNFQNVRYRGTPFPVFGKLLNVGLIYLGLK